MENCLCFWNLLCTLWNNLRRWNFPCPVLGNLAPPIDIFGDCRHFGVYLELPLHTAESAGETSRKSVILRQHETQSDLDVHRMLGGSEELCGGWSDGHKGLKSFGGTRQDQRRYSKGGHGCEGVEVPSRNLEPRSTTWFQRCVGKMKDNAGKLKRGLLMNSLAASQFREIVFGEYIGWVPGNWFVAQVSWGVPGWRRGRSWTGIH